MSKDSKDQASISQEDLAQAKSQAIQPGHRPVRLALFASGTGTNARAILEAHARGTLPGLEPVLLFSDKDSPAAAHAKSTGLDTLILYPKDYPSRQAHEEAVLVELKKHRIDLIALAGYMRLLTPTLINAYEGRILNIHPSLLPEFPGINSIERAYILEVPFSGVTIHLVDEGMDTGPILRQEKVELKPGMTLEEFEQAIHQLEHKLYPATLVDYAREIQQGN